MKLWKSFIDQVWQVEEPISTQDAIRIFLAVVMPFTLVLATWLGYQASSAVI